MFKAAQQPWVILEGTNHHLTAHNRHCHSKIQWLLQHLQSKVILWNPSGFFLVRNTQRLYNRVVPLQPSTTISVGRLHRRPVPGTVSLHAGNRSIRHWCYQGPSETNPASCPVPLQPTHEPCRAPAPAFFSSHLGSPTLQRDGGDRLSSWPCLGSTDVTHVTLLEEHLQAVKKGKWRGEHGGTPRQRMQHPNGPQEQDKSQSHCPTAPVTLVAPRPRVLKDCNTCGITILCSARLNCSSSSDTSNSNHSHGYTLLLWQAKGPLSSAFYTFSTSYTKVSTHY